MHDTILMHRILKSLEELCTANKIQRVKSMSLVVSPGSHINTIDLHEHLKMHNGDLIGDWTKINLSRQDDVEDLTAVIKGIEGDVLEE